jgi:hypothetical protein
LVIVCPNFKIDLTSSFLSFSLRGFSGRVVVLEGEEVLVVVAAVLEIGKERLYFYS